MADKFSILRRRFQTLFEQGKSYSEIAEELGINVPTVNNWRIRLGIPPRRDRTPRSWMDFPIASGRTPREILQAVAKPLGITEHDIEFILTRVDKLRITGAAKGRNITHLILASAFKYLQWEGSGRRPVSPKKFVEICKDFDITRATLLRDSSLFTSVDLFPKEHLKPEMLLERTWRSLQDKYALPETIKTRILTLIKDVREHLKYTSRTPNTVAAGCTYVACYESNQRITQGDLEEFFGVTEVTIRSMLKVLKEIHPSLKDLLGGEDDQ